MSEQPKKARDIKDLKARLGRPGPGSMPNGGPGPMSGIPGPMPMPGTMGPGIPRPADVPAPFGGPMGQPGRSGRPPADPFAAPPPGARGVPPMGPAAGMPGMPPPSARPPMGAPLSAPPATVQADPFAAAPAGSSREVRLVIDDKAVSDAEVGRQSGGKFIAAAVVASLVGIAVGWFVGSTVRERQLYDRVLGDAKEVYETTTKAAPTVEKAQKLIDQAVKLAAPGGGKELGVDFKAIEELRALTKPFPADVFSRKLYGAFEPATVDSLFTYYNQTNQLWAKINSIAGKTLGPASREALTKAASAAGQHANNEYGCVPFKDGDNFACGLVTVNREDSKDPKMVKVAVRGNSADKNLFTGQDLTSKTSDFVIMVDKGRSNDILGAATNQFQVYARDLMEAKTLADQTVEIQGRLTQQLGEIAKLEALN